VLPMFVLFLFGDTFSLAMSLYSMEVILYHFDVPVVGSLARYFSNGVQGIMTDEDPSLRLSIAMDSAFETRRLV